MFHSINNATYSFLSDQLFNTNYIKKNCGDTSMNEGEILILVIPMTQSMRYLQAVILFYFCHDDIGYIMK